MSNYMPIQFVFDLKAPKVGAKSVAQQEFKAKYHEALNQLKKFDKAVDRLSNSMFVNEKREWLHWTWFADSSASSYRTGFAPEGYTDKRAAALAAGYTGFSDLTIGVNVTAFNLEKTYGKKTLTLDSPDKLENIIRIMERASEQGEKLKEILRKLPGNQLSDADQVRVTEHVETYFYDLINGNTPKDIGDTLKSLALKSDTNNAAAEPVRLAYVAAKTPSEKQETTRGNVI